jgi:hypothetical protein
MRPKAESRGQVLLLAPMVLFIKPAFLSVIHDQSRKSLMPDFLVQMLVKMLVKMKVIL